MMRFVVMLTLVVLCFSSAAFAQDEGLGVGVIFGERTGVSFKYWTTGTTAIAGGIAWSFGNVDSLYLHADYLLHNFTLFQIETGQLPVYYGLGARVRLVADTGNINRDNQVGVRVPLGLNYLFADPRLDVFFEIVPLLDLAPRTRFNLDWGIGVRYFFQ